MLDGRSPWRLHFAQNAALIFVSLLLLPLDTFILCASYVLYAVAPQTTSTARRRVRHGTKTIARPKTILVTGVGMTKGLSLARAFYQAGHKVIGADFEPYRIPVNGRFSRALAKFYALPKPNEEDGSAYYIQELLNIVRREKVDLWVSCSGVASAVEDGEAKEVMERRSDCRAIQFDVKTTATLHEKHSFIQHTMSLGLPAPETQVVTSRSAVHRVLHGAEVKEYIMKSVGVDDATRGNMTLLPRPTVSETYHHLSTISISKDKPWVLQQYIRGEEYCTHALVVKGDVKAFVACPSSELLMHYQALPPDSALSQSMLKFTKEFATRTGTHMTGHLSFDFLVEEKATENGLQKRLYPIECNPRAHTAVVLFDGPSSADMVDSYLTALVAPDMNGTTPTTITTATNGQPTHHPTIIQPRNPASYYWSGHDLVALVLYPFFQLLTLKITPSDFIQGISTFLQHLLFWKDGTFEIWDPLPWWWLYHVYWPGQFLACLLQRRKWSRVNVSTTKMFGC
ncbi:hypothetical protein MMC24_004602 [Lignoscripta atroalba]|nr:hypothetical protein [Lignoscripta atroalba]